MLNMRKARLLAAACVLALLVPSPAGAWGYAGHRLIMSRAIDLLPAELQPFFARHRDEIVARSIDPDLWRTAGWEDDPHHFLNFGARELGDYPFTELPREYGAAIEKFGMAALRRHGMLPWRAAEESGNLRRAFEGFKHNARYSPSDVVLFAPAAGHYIQDAHQPLHATHNYDGQLSGNRGVHARFERDLIERFGSRLRLNPATPKATTNARDAAFDALLASYRLVDAVLEADTEASGGTDTYDDSYFERFFGKARAVLEQRLSDSISATAGIIMGAWEQAGRPPVRP
jgi:hypothetical protein